MRKLMLLAVLLMSVFIAGGTATAAPPQSRTFFAVLSGANEVPPRVTPAVGFATFHVNSDETALTYHVWVANIENVVAAHIHLGGPDENGPVVAFLFGPAAPGSGPVNGLLASGTVTADDLVNDLAGHPLSDLIEQMRAGNTYANVHTDDGVDPPNTGAGDFPGGEIRGQIMSFGPR